MWTVHSPMERNLAKNSYTWPTCPHTSRIAGPSSRRNHWLREAWVSVRGCRLPVTRSREQRECGHTSKGICGAIAKAATEPRENERRVERVDQTLMAGIGAGEVPAAISGLWFEAAT